jgi:hypothetical protein
MKSVRMPRSIDERHLKALLGSAGKSIAGQPGAKGLVARIRLAASPQDLTYVLQNMDLGLEEPARRAIFEAAADKERWRETHALLLSSAERQLVERFHASS